MNERIRELMSQTLDEKFAGTWSRMDMQDLTKFAERFAELIVRECAEIADCNWRNACPGVYVKEHFGVEEQPICKHDWYSARNPVVKNGSVCVICGALDSREPEELKND